MVEPENHVTIIVKIRSGHRDGLVGVVREDGKGAGSIKGHTTYSAGIDVVLGQDTLDGGTDTSPDIICGLLLYRASVLSQQA